MTRPHRARILSMIIEVTLDDGTVEEHEVIEEDKPAYMIRATSSNHEATFWIASDDPNATQGNMAIAGSDYLHAQLSNPASVRDLTNTMVGMIRDGACNFSYVIADTDSLGLVK